MHHGGTERQGPAQAPEAVHQAHAALKSRIIGPALAALSANRYPLRMSDAGDTADVSVVVVTYESGPTLGRCLQALKVQTVQGFETILSDNGSRDGAAQAAAAADPALVLLDNRANLGFAAGNNRAAGRAR